MLGRFSKELIAQLEHDGRVRSLVAEGGRIVAATATVDEALERAFAAVDGYHAARPLELGMPRELLRQSLDLHRSAFDALVASEPNLEALDTVVRRAGFVIRLGSDQQAIVNRFLGELRQSGFQPPTTDEAGVSSVLVQAMVAMGTVVAVADGIVFLPGQIVEAEAHLRAALASGHSISLADYRDLLGTTRKYAQALLEYFDRQRVTRRIGDRRVAIGPAMEQEGEPSQ